MTGKKGNVAIKNDRLLCLEQLNQQWNPWILSFSWAAPRSIVKELRKKSARQEGYKSVTENKWVAQVVELFRFNKEVKKYEGY